MLTEIRLQLDRAEEGWQRIVPVLDGRSLIDLVAEYEAAAHIEPRVWDGINVGSLGYDDLLDDLTGRSAWPGQGETVVLGCSCGEIGCAPLYAEVDLSDTTVVWRDFCALRGPAPEWAGFGPFTFDRAQLADEVRWVVDAPR